MKTIEEIQDEWSKDSKIDESNLSGESLKIPLLHSKYLKALTSASLKLKKLREDRKILMNAKHRYYMGTMDKEEMEKFGWKPNKLMIPRNDISMYAESDDDMVKMNLKVALYEEITSMLDSILKSINNRNFTIKNAIDFNKFINGI